MSFGIIFLVCLAVACAVIYWQISRSGGIEVINVVFAVCITMVLCVFINAAMPGQKEDEPYSVGKDPTRLQMTPPDSQSTTTPAPKPEPTTAPPPAPKPSPQPAPQSEPSLTVEEFDKRFLDRLNVAAQTLGVDPAESMGTPEHRGNMLIYQISSTAHMEELITAAGGLRGVNIVTHDLDQSTVKSALIFYFCAIAAFDPSADINTVVDALGIDPNSPDVVMLKHTTINGITYKKEFVDKKTLVLSVKQ